MRADQQCVLVVEDNAHDREMLVRAFELAGMDGIVETVRTGPEAIEFLRGRYDFERIRPARPALVLLDIKLPYRDGLSVLADIKDDERTKTIPVVMLTSSGEAGDIEAAYRAGANAYIVKPTNFSEFVANIRDTVQFWLAVNTNAK
ncbi:MAG TPA: response regulator [Spirochaetota bacterium]|nr:response regulator [Spirochaetota bacterium]HNT13002.1 response regulator [Spirochaetota bacterium]